MTARLDQATPRNQLRERGSEELEVPEFLPEDG